jgi:methanogenic corrinoid protein MtbC1
MNEDMKSYQETFSTYLKELDKERSYEYALSLLSENRVTVPELYEEVIAPVLNSIVVGRQDEDTVIWREHTMTGIARTIVECAYPFVLQASRKAFPGGNGRKVIILCPEEEYHELGARMGADYFKLEGYEVFFIGGNTPKENFYSAYETLKPDIIAISVTNYLNLVPLKGIISGIREKAESGVRVILSGSAFHHAGKTAEDFGADLLVRTFRDLSGLEEVRR